MSSKPRSSHVPRKRAARRHPPLPDIAPPLVRIADCWTNRSIGRYGYTPFSKGQLAKEIARRGIEIRSLGPRTGCITRADLVLLLQGAPAEPADAA